ncbi:MAG: phosphocholine cytidylyltransferase family protein [Deltaproteobacteria bacterium]|nr:MAG: phosphocholine cytidylyltransferase family protein [Deltaproteobacteria bacterium]
MKIDTAVILAAGRGSRLSSLTDGGSKPLVPFFGLPLILHNILALQEIGIEHLVVVLGYRGEEIQRVVSHDVRVTARITWVINEEWHKSNGISLLAAAPLVSGNFLLLMADHLFDLGILDRLVGQPLHDGLILCVDRKLDTIFDMEDATKVQVDRGRIVDIGKTIPAFNAVDTGIFACTPAIFPALSTIAQERGDVSLSEGVKRLALEGRAFVMDIEGGWWQDVDTPESYRHAQWLFLHGCSDRTRSHEGTLHGSPDPLSYPCEAAISFSEFGPI